MRKRESVSKLCARAFGNCFDFITELWSYFYKLGKEEEEEAEEAMREAKNKIQLSIF